MKKLKDSKQEQGFDYQSEVAKLKENVYHITMEIAEELELAKDTFDVTSSNFEDGSDDIPMIAIEVPDIRSSVIMKGRCSSYLFSTDGAFKKELMFCLKFALGIKETTTGANYESIYYVMEYSPLGHSFACNMYRQGCGVQGTYFEVKFDPYDEKLSGEVEFGYRLPELYYRDYRYKTGSWVGELLPVLTSDIIFKLVVNTQIDISMMFDANKQRIDCTKMWLSVQLALNGICDEACTILLLALERMDIKSSTLDCYKDIVMCPMAQDSMYAPANNNAIVKFKLAHGDTDIFDVIIFQSGFERQLVITDGTHSRLVINLSGIQSYHKARDMVVNFICR